MWQKLAGIVLCVAMILEWRLALVAGFLGLWRIGTAMEENNRLSQLTVADELLRQLGGK